jgi:hypothetical protein
VNSVRTFLVGLVVILALILGWVSYDELQRREALANQPLQTTESTTRMSVTPSTTTESLEPQSEPIPSEPLPPEFVQVSPSTSSNNSASSNNEATPATTPPSLNTTTLASNEAPQDPPVDTNDSETTSETPAPEPSTTTDTTATNEASPACSSFDESGLLAAFDGSLAAFIADATATYGNQYGNLHYQLSSKSGTITDEQGTVTTSYSGTVQELSTGAEVSANGIITANFAWDGCTWQLVDYSF